MKPTQTGIAVALALAVVIFFFVFNGMSFFSPPPSAQDVTPEAATTTSSTATTTMPFENVTQLEMKDEVIGTGTTATTGDTVTVQYVGALIDGTVFDASAKHGTAGFTFKLGAGQVIRGWDEGVVGMKEGGKRLLVIPASLAYGSQSPAPSIPPNSTLVFEVELVKVQK